ncbi:hypothetical protein, partial [Burkholderia pseudomallei]|uniref:hypothetical protein n=1 Tax=Burkholderia pseudomallei TaxID=28450 RepID=UPI001C7F975F
EFLERHHLEFVLRGHGRLQHHAIKKQKPRTWRGFVSNLKPPGAGGSFVIVLRAACAPRFT